MINLSAEDYQDYLDKLLVVKLPAMANEERESIDRAAQGWETRLIIYGAGSLGQRMLEGLRRHGVQPIAFVDRNPVAQNRCIDGLKVLSPEVAAQRFGGEAVIAVAVWNPALHGGILSITDYLQGLGWRQVISFIQVFWRYPKTFLPHFLCDLPSRILPEVDLVRQAYMLFQEPESRLEFLRQLELRLTGDFAALPPPSQEAQYFSDRLVRPLREEYFVDCGAYDGDTLVGLAEWTGGTFRQAIAFEADPRNFVRLERQIAADQRLCGRTRAISAAVGGARRRLRFAATGMGNAGLSDDGNIEVDCVPLDEALEADLPTFIKMDIEGAEVDALAGATKVISRARPVLAICAYHLQRHLWEIPLLIRRLLPDSSLFLRMHCNDGFDLVCYGIPSSRPFS